MATISHVTLASLFLEETVINTVTTKVGRPVSLPKFDPRYSVTQSRTDNHLTTLFGGPFSNV